MKFKIFWGRLQDVFFGKKKNLATPQKFLRCKFQVEIKFVTFFGSKLPTLVICSKLQFWKTMWKCGLELRPLTMWTSKFFWEDFRMYSYAPKDLATPQKFLRCKIRIKSSLYHFLGPNFHLQNSLGRVVEISDGNKNFIFQKLCIWYSSHKIFMVISVTISSIAYHKLSWWCHYLWVLGYVWTVPLRLWFSWNFKFTRLHVKLMITSIVLMKVTNSLSERLLQILFSEEAL